jgi:hypothetical protein
VAGGRVSLCAGSRRPAGTGILRSKATSGIMNNELSLSDHHIFDEIDAQPAGR